MSETLAQHMADEWWFKVRERMYSRKYVHPVNSMTEALIQDDLMRSGQDFRFTAGDIARGACEILKERVKQETNSIMAEGIERWVTSESK